MIEAKVFPSQSGKREPLVNIFYRFLPLRSIALAAALLLPLAGTAYAQAGNYPSRPIRLVVPFEPGGSTDITARFVAEEVGKRLGQAWVVENDSGTGGSRGTDIVARATPDGYTLLWANVAPVAINAHLYKSLPYDTVRDFAPITLATVFPNVLVVKPAMKGDTLATFLQKAKTDYKSLSFGSAGNGSSTHLAGEWLKSLSGADWLHVPFKGGSPALIAVASGQVDMYFSAVPSALPFIKTGQVHAIATTGRARDPSLPEIPTVAEQGFAQYDVVNWNGLLAPAKTPPQIVELLNKVTVAALNSPQLKARLAAQGALASPMSAKAFGEYIAGESAKWGRLVNIAHAKIE
ncbi:MAG: tripartite tricarboxylate transporter substrate binding protein [Betaproteobacteria bacterium]|nr:tripartite tricarboxylate transporter substrate binding protein [Betaproteobacteria bacterium]